MKIYFVVGGTFVFPPTPCFYLKFYLIGRFFAVTPGTVGNIIVVIITVRKHHWSRRKNQAPTRWVLPPAEFNVPK